MIYFDSAYIAKFYLDEPDSERVRRFAQESGEVACCLHGRAEALIAFHRKFREGAFSPKAFAAVTDQFVSDCNLSIWVWLPLSANLLEQLAQRVRSLGRGIFLRSADALHLASAAEQGFHEIYSNDRHLVAAAKYFGLRSIVL
jgi:predicted nucleic acid-binding protein